MDEERDGAVCTAKGIVEGALEDPFQRPQVNAFFHAETCTVSYVVRDVGSNACAIIDSVLDFDPANGRTWTGAAEEIGRFVRDNDLRVAWHLETHVHADHLSAANRLRATLGGRLGIGRAVALVQAHFSRLFSHDIGLQHGGFDHLFGDGDPFQVGRVRAIALSIPGHTPADMAYVIGDAVFVGDILLMPDSGSGRADFPGGDAAQLYRSAHRLFNLPSATRMFVGHDYNGAGRETYAWETTVGAQRTGNVHLRAGVTQHAFVALRSARDDQLPAPRLLIPAMQINLRAGQMPTPEANGIAYLKIPLNAL